MERVHGAEAVRWCGGCVVVRGAAAECARRALRMSIAAMAVAPESGHGSSTIACAGVGYRVGTGWAAGGALGFRPSLWHGGHGSITEACIGCGGGSGGGWGGG